MLFRSMSGTLGKQLSDYERDMTPNVKRMLEILGIGENEVEKLEELPHAQIADAYYQAHLDLGGAGNPYFGPMKNEDYLGDPVFNGFSEAAKKAPLIVGSVYSEFTTLPAKYQRYAMTDEEMVKACEEELGKENADKLIPIFQKAFPEKKIIDLLTYDYSAVRGAAMDFIRARLRDGCAETYNYFFSTVFGTNEGTTAPHSSDIPFIFHNTSLVPSADLGAEETKRLEYLMSGRFIAFAKTGKPQLEGEEEWPACTKEREATMVYNVDTTIQYGVDKELLEEMGKRIPSSTL